MKPSVQQICELVCNHCEVTLEQMVSKDKHRSIVEARQIAMWIARKRLGLSFPELGREFGNRDHTTVMAAVQRMDRATGRTLLTLRALYEQFSASAPRKVGTWSDATGARELDFGAVAE